MGAESREQTAVKKERRTVAIVSLGCKVNQAEGEDMSSAFLASGFEVAKRGEASDIVVVNTCTVTNEADRKSRKAINRACKLALEEVASGEIASSSRPISRDSSQRRNDATYDGMARPLVVVTGCYAAIAAEELKKIKGVSLVIPQAGKAGLVEQVLRVFASEATQSQQGDHHLRKASSAKTLPPRNDNKDSTHASRLAPHGSRLTGKRVRAFLKVQDGCDNRCSYCIVPDARGNPVSVPVATVLRSAEALVIGGAKEIVLTGINIGKYLWVVASGEIASSSRPISRDSSQRRNDATYDGTTRLKDIVELVLRVPGVERVRISSIEPEDVTLDLINMLGKGEEGNHSDEIASFAKNRHSRKDNEDTTHASRLAPHGSRLTNAYLCPHLHIPLQSGDRRVLARMGRRYTPSDYLRLINSIRFACPDVAITTDVIVGFPGETEDEFTNTIKLLENAKPSRIHVFKYSKRAGTPAADMPDQVTDDTKTKRSEAVRKLGERLAAEYRERFAGKELDVLVEREKDGLLFGTSENYLNVSFSGTKTLIGRCIRLALDDKSGLG